MKKERRGKKLLELLLKNFTLAKRGVSIFFNRYITLNL